MASDGAPTQPAEQPEQGEVGPIEQTLRLVTLVHLLLSSASLAVGSDVQYVIAGVFFVAFVVGMVVAAAAFVIAAGRSRDEDVTVVGAFFLGDRAVPTARKRAFWALVGVQTVVGFTVASLEPFTAVAFSLLVPLLGVGLAGLYGSRHGRFAKRVASQ